MPDHPRWTHRRDVPDAPALFETVLAARMQHAADARSRGDTDAERFWFGIVAVVEAMRHDLTNHPRPAPEVRAFLERATTTPPDTH